MRWQAARENAKRRKSCTRGQALGDVAPGLLKHLLNEQIEHAAWRRWDAYMQTSRRQPLGQATGIWEECLYVWKGRGYDLHRTAKWKSPDTYHGSLKPR